MFVYFILNDQGKYEETKGTYRAEVHVLLRSDPQSLNWWVNNKPELRASVCGLLKLQIFSSEEKSNLSKTE